MSSYGAPSARCRLLSQVAGQELWARCTRSVDGKDFEQKHSTYGGLKPRVGHQNEGHKPKLVWPARIGKAASSSLVYRLSRTASQFYQSVLKDFECFRHA